MNLMKALPFVIFTLCPAAAIEWKHLSCTRGELPNPGGSNQ
jgi:hypothetical protein